jgi:hypothetical protein
MANLSDRFAKSLSNALKRKDLRMEMVSPLGIDLQHGQNTASISHRASVTCRSPPSNRSKTSTRSRGFISANTASRPLNGPRRILTRSPGATVR